MRRRRFQKGSLQIKRYGKRRVWVVQYWDADGRHPTHLIGPVSQFTKSQAQEAQAKLMESVNGSQPASGLRPTLVSEFVNSVYLPFQRGNWKKSTQGTSENRIRLHIVGDLGNWQLQSFTPTVLQKYLEGKAATHGFSVVDHLRWDLTSIFKLAVAEKVLTANPAAALYTPPSAKKGDCPVMTAVEVEIALGAVELREKVILHLAIFTGLRPGEILAIQRSNIALDGSSIEIVQRVYRGHLDSPKNGKTRVVAVPPRTAGLLVGWLNAAVGSEPNAWLFPSENPTTPLWCGNLLRRHIHPALERVNLGWVDFKVMRRTNGTLSHVANVDPKVSADQRGHGLGVSMEIYTKSNVDQKALAARMLEDSVYGLKAAPESIM